MKVRLEIKIRAISLLFSSICFCSSYCAEKSPQFKVLSRTSSGTSISSAKTGELVAGPSVINSQHFTSGNVDKEMSEYEKQLTQEKRKCFMLNVFWKFSFEKLRQKYALTEKLAKEQREEIELLKKQLAQAKKIDKEDLHVILDNLLQTKNITHVQRRRFTGIETEIDIYPI